MTWHENDDGDGSDPVLIHTEAILAAVDENGVKDQDVYRDATAALAASKMFLPTLTTWAGILASTHSKAEQPLASCLEDIPGEESRDLIRRHGRALINGVRAADGPGGGEILRQRWARVLEVFSEHDLTLLAWAMAVTVKPVLTTLGGLERYRAVGALVQGSLVKESPVDLAGPTVAALCAIAHGEVEAGKHYLAPYPPRQVLVGVLIPLAAQIMPASAEAAAYVVDSSGVPEAVVDPQDKDYVLLSGLLTSLHSQDLDQASASAAAIDAATVDEVAVLTWNLAATLGVYLGARFTRNSHVS